MRLPKPGLRPTNLYGSVRHVRFVKAPPSKKASTQYQAPPSGVGLYASQAYEPNLIPWMGVSLGAHVGLILAIWLLMVILQFLGWKIPTFDMAMKPRDVEFVLVDNAPAQKPRKPTRVKAERDSRSGGQKIANRPQAMPQQAAGAPSPKAVAKAASKPQPTPKPAQPRQVARAAPAKQAPTPQPPQKSETPPTPKPAPPAPKVPNRTEVAHAPTLPAIPTVKMPALSAPKNPSPAAGGGVVAKTASTSTGGGSQGGSSGAPSPTTIQGSPGRAGGSPGGGGRPGGSSGSGGQGAYNQAGSPGGGGGRAGIDAEAEPDFGPYIAELQRRIRRNWAPPVEDRSKRVVVLFTIARDGRLIGRRVQTSSGSAQADQAAMAAVSLSAPFRALPPNFKGQNIDVQFIFDYEIYGNGGNIRRTGGG